MAKTARCLHPCGCTSDMECPHYECGDTDCVACYEDIDPPEEEESE